METITSEEYRARYGNAKPRVKGKKAQQNKVQPENNGSNTIIRATFDLPPLGNRYVVNGIVMRYNTEQNKRETAEVSLPLQRYRQTPKEVRYV